MTEKIKITRSRFLEKQTEEANQSSSENQSTLKVQKRAERNSTSVAELEECALGLGFRRFEWNEKE